MALPADVGIERGGDGSDSKGITVSATGPMAGLAADIGLDEFTGFHIQPDGVAAMTAL